MSHVYLVKANDELISHCRCKDAPITFPPQMDCPWCGCGWLFTCANCRKAFTFARGIVVEESWEQSALRDLNGRQTGKPSKEDVGEWIGAMQVLLKDVEPGKEYVCLDGWFIPTDASEVAIEGWHSMHNLSFVPQVTALTDSSIVDDVLSSVAYWERTRLQSEGDDE